MDHASLEKAFERSQGHELTSTVLGFSARAYLEIHRHEYKSFFFFLRCLKFWHLLSHLIPEE